MKATPIADQTAKLADVMADAAHLTNTLKRDMAKARGLLEDMAHGIENLEEARRRLLDDASVAVDAVVYERAQARVAR